jgi:hypothetical protein
MHTTSPTKRSLTSDKFIVIPTLLEPLDSFSYIAAAILVVAYDFGSIFNQGMKDPHKFFQTFNNYNPDGNNNIEMLYWLM